MALGKRHYERMAAILRAEYEQVKRRKDQRSMTLVENLTASFADVYSQANSGFDRAKFYRAALGRSTVREQVNEDATLIEDGIVPRQRGAS